MFDNLSDKLQSIFSGLRGKGRLTEDDIDSAMREIRMALLEADVNFKVVKEFTKRTKERCLTAEVLDSLTPAQNVVKIVLDELTALMGEEGKPLQLSSRIPNVIMLVGLQGSGKTTAAAKLAYLLKQQNHNPLLCACDVYRPAAADQLQTLGEEIGVRVYRGEGKDPVKIAKEGVRDAVDSLRDVVIVDTAGRLHVDEEMMAEAEAIKAAVEPDQIYMVVDAMTGQDAVNVAKAFADRVDFDGVIMSKMDGDARGGGALSIKQVTGKPIMFISQGKMGGVQKLIGALPGGDKAMREGQVNEHALDEMAVIIGSMTKREREHPEILNGSRKARVAAGAGVKVFQVNQLLKQFTETKKMVRSMMNAQEAQMNRKGKGKGKKGKKGKGGRRRMGLPGMGGMSMADVKKMQEMMSGLDDSAFKR